MLDEPCDCCDVAGGARLSEQRLWGVCDSAAPSRSRRDYAVIYCARSRVIRMVPQLITRSGTIAQTALDGARGRLKERPRQALPLSLYVTSSYLFLLAGPSKAQRKPRRRICQLPDASQARCQESFGLLGRLYASFLCSGCCCFAACAAATKKPRKAVPARPRAAHVRRRKSDDE